MCNRFPKTVIQTNKVQLLPPQRVKFSIKVIWGKIYQVFPDNCASTSYTTAVPTQIMQQLQNSYTNLWVFSFMVNLGSSCMSFDLTLSKLWPHNWGKIDHLKQPDSCCPWLGFKSLREDSQQQNSLEVFQSGSLIQLTVSLGGNLASSINDTVSLAKTTTSDFSNETGEARLIFLLRCQLKS